MVFLQLSMCHLFDLRLLQTFRKNGLALTILFCFKCLPPCGIHSRFINLI